MKKLLIFFLFTINICFSQELKKESWVVEWGEIEGINLSLSNKLLQTSIPNYFMDNIQKELNHYLTKEEELSVLEDLRNAKILELKNSLSTKIEKLDNLFFDRTSTKAQRVKATDEIEKVREDIELYENINLLKVKRVVNLPISFLPLDRSALSTKKDYQIKFYMFQNKIDYYITGELEEVADNLILKLILYSKYNDSVVIWNGIGSSEEILNYRDQMLDKLSRYIISDNIKPIVIEAYPRDSLIYINKEFVGLGSYSGYFMYDKNLKISIMKEGFKPVKLSYLDVAENRVSAELIPIDVKTITVNSIPESASLHYGSKFIGVTPFEVPVYSFAEKLTISLEGYMDKSIVIDSKSRDVTVVLSDKIIDREANFLKKKNQFYNATAIFSFSIAAPLFFNSQGDSIDPVINNISIGNAIFWGANLFYRLYQYLRAAEISVE